MGSTDKTSSTTAVIVSFNRRELLLESVAAVFAQTDPPGRVIVVDNASNDGSADAIAAAHPAVDLVRLERNVGGAGGFAVGIAHALESGSRWIWLMDDDTVPTPDALLELKRAAEADPRVSIAGSRVIWTDGSDHPMNTPREKFLVTVHEREEAARVAAMAVRSSSFVSMLIRASVARERGLPVADYFIWNDDFEYSTRLLRGRRGLFVPASVVIHKTKLLGSTDADPGPRFYYEVRNKLWMLLRSKSLSPFEKILYGGSTIRRWIRTMARTSDRRVLIRGALRGFHDGVAPPRPNAEVLAGLGASSDAVLRAERGSENDS